MDKGSAAADKIFKQILKDIKPSEAEVKETTKKVNQLMLLLKTIVPREVELRVAGSIARGTNLKGNSDIDIFMLFRKSLDRDQIVKLGLSYGKKIVEKEKGKYEVKYAEHPYIRLYLDSVGMKVDLVPALKIDNIEEMGTTVDRTPMHTEFINSHLTDKQRDDVRLLKAFLKAHNIYGAEVKINGFSGYLCELLIHQYGSFHKLLVEISKAKLPIMLEPKYSMDSKNAELTKKFNSEFVVVDPVDGNRNVAAGVSMESLGRFVILARRFTAKPDISMFYGKKIPANTAAVIKEFSDATALDTFLISFKVPDKSEDVIYPQLRKINQQIVMHIRHNGFEVSLASQFICEREGFIFIMAPRQTLGSRMVKGPDIFMFNAIYEFTSQHKDAFGFTISGTTIHALEKSRYGTIEEMLKKLPPTITKHKDINMSGSKLVVNSIPKQYAEMVYLEIHKKLAI